MEQRFNKAVERLAEIEQAFCIFKQETQESFFAKTQELETMERQIAELTEKYNAAVERFNKAVETINAMSERISELEANYDPTIIKQ